MTPSDASSLERYLHDHIPISRHLGTRVLDAGANAVRLAAPLAQNVNHRQTVFGGSLSALAILAAWAWLHVNLRGDGFVGQIVIQSHSMKYLAPADADFEALCRAPGEERWAHFRQTLVQRHRARIELDAELSVGERLVASFRGQYAALRTAGTRAASTDDASGVG